MTCAIPEFEIRDTLMWVHTRAWERRNPSAASRSRIGRIGHDRIATLSAGSVASTSRQSPAST
jgi:hypothetical protein